MTEKSVLCKQDVYAALYGIHEKEVDVIFADPPYQENHYERLLGVLKEMSYVSEDTLLVLESELNKDFSFALIISCLFNHSCSNICIKR